MSCPKSLHRHSHHIHSLRLGPMHRGEALKPSQSQWITLRNSSHFAMAKMPNFQSLFNGNHLFNFDEGPISTFFIFIILEIRHLNAVSFKVVNMDILDRHIVVIVAMNSVVRRQPDIPVFDHHIVCGFGLSSFQRLECSAMG